MSAPAPASIQADAADTADGWERALLDHRLEGLRRLAEMGLALAGSIQERATRELAGSVTDAVPHHAAMDFSRVARAVRMTYALESRLIAEFKGRSGGAEADEADDGPPQVYWLADGPQVEQRRRVQRIVKRVALASALDRERVERLVYETGERLEDDDIYGDVMTRPIREIVALICKDLGLQPDWNLLADIYWAREEIAHSPPGSPYAGWKDRQAQGRGDAIARAPPWNGGAVP